MQSLQQGINEEGAKENQKIVRGAKGWKVEVVSIVSRMNSFVTSLILSLLAITETISMPMTKDTRMDVGIDVGIDNAMRDVDNAMRNVDNAMRDVDNAMRDVDNAMRNVDNTITDSITRNDHWSVKGMTRSGEKNVIHSKGQHRGMARKTTRTTCSEIGLEGSRREGNERKTKEGKEWTEK